MVSISENIDSGKCLVKVVGIRKVYRMSNEKVVALNKIDLAVNKGEICCILGKSGCGKSTLLNMMAGLEKPTKGSVCILGQNISKMSERKLASFRQKYIGFIFQAYNLLPALTAMENVAMPLMFRGMRKSRRSKLAAKMLKAVGLSGRYNHKPSEMSGGQQQRVGIARAFVARPALVFADEPTGNLDSKTTNEVMKMIVGMARKHNQTLIIVTHDRGIASYADRIITLLDGSVISDEHITKTVPMVDEAPTAEGSEHENLPESIVDSNGLQEAKGNGI